MNSSEPSMYAEIRMCQEIDGKLRDENSRDR